MRWPRTTDAPAEGSARTQRCRRRNRYQLPTIAGERRAQNSFANDRRACVQVLANGLARGDDAGVEAEEVKSAVEARVLNLEAAVHDDRQALALAVDCRIL